MLPRAGLALVTLCVAACFPKLEKPDGRACDRAHRCNAGQACHLERCVDLASCPTCVSRTGIILPLYADPSAAAWQTLIDAKKSAPTVPMAVIVNPSNGPGTSPSAAMTQRIAVLHDAGILTFGYVWVADATRAKSDVLADIDAYAQIYPGLDGIFISQQPTVSGNEAYLRDAASRARSNGMKAVAGAPGPVPESYYGVLDVVVVSPGGAGLPGTDWTQSWYAHHAPDEFAIIAYGVPLDLSFITRARGTIGWIYLTDDGGTNPWDTVASYIKDLAGALAK